MYPLNTSGLQGQGSTFLPNFPSFIKFYSQLQIKTKKYLTKRLFPSLQVHTMSFQQICIGAM